jgi:hypothetical protein
VNSYVPAILPDGRQAGLTSGFPAPVAATIPANGIITNPPVQVYDVINPNFKEGYVQSWNVAYQRALPKNFTFEAAYVGNKGVHIPMPYNLNAGVVLGAGAAGRPYNRNVDINYRFASSDNEYNALQVKFDKRYSGGFLLTTAYTWAKAMANAGDDNGGPAFYINPQRNWAPAGFDRKHTFVQSYIYELPFGKGKPWLNQGPAQWVLGGWQVNGILTLMSGQAINYSSNVATNARVTRRRRMSVVRSGSLAASSTVRGSTRACSLPRRRTPSAMSAATPEGAWLREPRRFAVQTVPVRRI